jgi:hypothetical protein
MTGHRPCYGKLFPSVTWRQCGSERPDGVFSYVYQQPGSVRRRPDIRVDIEAWDRCLECRDFSSCIQLSTATITLEAAVRN